MRVRRSGFTLIELLVVIAIIAILAAMLFPVFARARESARKIQCLANVKNIATAVQMYLSDYDRLPPKEHRADVQAAFDSFGDKSGCQYSTLANPYLRWPVVLDEYVKNRDVWRCPSATRMPRTSICPGPDWFAATMQHQDEWGCYGSICTGIFPAGWGGTITDSWVQQDCPTSRTDGAHASGGFEQTIGYPQDAFEVKTSAMDDPAKYLVVAEVGVIDITWDSYLTAYPEVCGMACAASGCSIHADWVNCSDSQQCGAGDAKLAADPIWRKQFGRPRHLGGDNLGFADGHAAWMEAEAIVSGTIDTTQPNRTDWAITGGIQTCATNPSLR